MSCLKSLQTKKILRFTHSTSALVKIHVVFCCHGDERAQSDFTLESMEDEKALSYYGYRTTSIAERVKKSIHCSELQIYSQECTFILQIVCM